MSSRNTQKFEALKKLNLPIGQYVITGSGALGIRNLRDINDIDIIVTPELWNTLAEAYPITEENGIKKIAFPDGIVEAIGGGSFYEDKSGPTIAERIQQADIIDGLPFESLEHVVYFKRKMGREKDLQDLLLIETLESR